MSRQVVAPLPELEGDDLMHGGGVDASEPPPLRRPWTFTKIIPSPGRNAEYTVFPGSPQTWYGFLPIFCAKMAASLGP